MLLIVMQHVMHHNWYWDQSKNLTVVRRVSHDMQNNDTLNDA